MSNQNPEYWLTDADAKRAEYAPGIQDPTVYGDPSKLEVGSIVPYVQQLHHALRARRHYDVRLGKDKMLSWATKKELPRPGGKSIALFPQPEHDEAYSRYQGRIQTGYGAGTVRPIDLGKVMITQAEPDKIKFVMAHKRTPEEFTLVRMKAKEGIKPAWLMINSTPTEGPKYQKEKYKLIPAEQIDKLMDPQYVMSSKIDGAAAFVKLMKDKVDVLSLRQGAAGGPIVHTHRIGLGGRKLDIPKELQNTLLRGEIYGTRDGQSSKAIRPEELGGILNSTVEKSLATQKAKDIKLRLALFGAKEVAGKPWEGKSHEETRKIIQSALKHLPADIFSEPPYAYTPEDKQKMWEEITSGKSPITREGVIGFPTSGGTPVKVKPVQDYDVHIRELFPQIKGDTSLAGGFKYSLEPEGPVVGEVGTGFTREERKRMLEDPTGYIGRIARVTAQEQYPSGALRAPAYIARHEDPSVKSAALTLISGYLGSGKSTKAKQLAKDEGAKYIPVDVLRAENRSKSLKEFMQLLGKKAQEAIDSDKHYIMEGIHVAELDPSIISQAKRVIKLSTSETESTIRAITRNIERSKDKSSKMYGWPVMKVVRNVIENQHRFKSAIERFGKPDDKWVGVDLDSTLAKYHGWKGPEHIGKPVPKMLKLVKRLLDEGQNIKIFTARAADGKRAIDPIKAWCKKHLGRELEVTNVKDHAMSVLYDDRAITVGKNTGEIKSAALIEDKDPDLNMDHRRFSLQLDGRTIGRATASKKARANNTVEVTDLYVDPAYRGQGVASQLIDRIRDEHKSATLCLKPQPFADKLLSRDELVHVYEKLGFELRPGRRNEMTLSNAFKLGLEADSLSKTAAKKKRWDGKRIAPWAVAAGAAGLPAISLGQYLGTDYPLVKNILRDVPITVGKSNDPFAFEDFAAGLKPGDVMAQMGNPEGHALGARGASTPTGAPFFHAGLVATPYEAGSDPIQPTVDTMKLLEGGWAQRNKPRGYATPRSTAASPYLFDQVEPTLADIPEAVGQAAGISPTDRSSVTNTIRKIWQNRGDVRKAISDTMWQGLVADPSVARHELATSPRPTLDEAKDTHLYGISGREGEGPMLFMRPNADVDQPGPQRALQEQIVSSANKPYSEYRAMASAVKKVLFPHITPSETRPTYVPTQTDTEFCATPVGSMLKAMGKPCAGPVSETMPASAVTNPSMKPVGVYMGEGEVRDAYKDDPRSMLSSWLETAKKHRITAGLSGMLLMGLAGYGTVKGVQKVQEKIKAYQAKKRRQAANVLRDKVQQVIGQEVAPKALVNPEMAKTSAAAPALDELATEALSYSTPESAPKVAPTPIMETPAQLPVKPVATAIPAVKPTVQPVVPQSATVVKPSTALTQPPTAYDWAKWDAPLRVIAAKHPKAAIDYDAITNSARRIEQETGVRVPADLVAAQILGETGGTPHPKSKNNLTNMHRTGPGVHKAYETQGDWADEYLGLIANRYLPKGRTVDDLLNSNFTRVDTNKPYAQRSNYGAWIREIMQGVNKAKQVNQ